jgi:hypothetical protein
MSAKGVSAAPGPPRSTIDSCSWRRLLAGEVEAREDDDAVEPVRPPLARAALAGKRGTLVGPDPRLDRVEHVGHAYG